MPWHSPLIIQDATPKIVDALLMLIFWCSDIDINHIANRGGQYFDYGKQTLHSTWIIQDATPKSLTLC